MESVTLWHYIERHSFVISRTFPKNCTQIDLNISGALILKSSRNKRLAHFVAFVYSKRSFALFFDMSVFKKSAFFIWFTPSPPSGFMLSFKGFKCLSPTKQSSPLMLAGINGVLEDSLEMTRLPWPLGRSSSPLTGSIRDGFSAVQAFSEMSVNES